MARLKASCTLFPAGPSRHIIGTFAKVPSTETFPVLGTAVNLPFLQIVHFSPVVLPYLLLDSAGLPSDQAG
jgi:hypothetical protein